MTLAGGHCTDGSEKPFTDHDACDQADQDQHREQISPAHEQQRTGFFERSKQRAVLRRSVLAESRG
jgi:hypothetical protein